MVATVVVLSVVFIIALTIISTRWMLSKSKRILREWAESEGYTIISSEYRWVKRGPFSLRTGDEQVVFYVEVKTAGGGTNRGWVRCGGMWKGLAENKAEVRWDTNEGEGVSV